MNTHSKIAMNKYLRENKQTIAFISEVILIEFYENSTGEWVWIDQRNISKIKDKLIKR